MYLGQPKNALDTPALWVDLDVLDYNISSLSQFIKQAGVSWRPHVKSLKVIEVAQKLLNSGAIGVTCAKLGEAEALANSGITDILIANQIVGNCKIDRLVNLRRKADIIVAVDSFDNAQEISKYASNNGVCIRLLIEVDIGMSRCGVPPGSSVLSLAGKISTLPGVELAGLMAWEGGKIVKMADPDEKKRGCWAAVQEVVESAQLCRKNIAPMPIISCGGSGTYWITSQIPGVTEIQAGGAVYGSVAYRNWGVKLPYALFILATVVSRPAPTRAIVDAGHKAMDNSMAMPLLKEREDIQLAALHSEHGLLELDSPQVQLKVGDKLDFIAGYGDYTVNLHDTLYGIRNGSVEAVWSIMPRDVIR